MSRLRARTNGEVRELDYHEVLVSVTKHRTWIELLGPVLVNKEHQVKPHMVVSASTWISALMQRGISNGVIWPARFESSLRRQGAAIPVGVDAEQYIAQACNHFRCMLQVLRDMAHEESPAADPNKRRKTTSFRKEMKSSEHIVINALVGMLELDGSRATSPAVPSISETSFDVPAKKSVSATSTAISVSIPIPSLTFPKNLFSADFLDTLGMPAVVRPRIA